MQIDTDGLAARVDDLVDHLERPQETTMLRVLESKAAAGDVAIAVTSAAMRVCGGAAFSKHLAIERLFAMPMRAPSWRRRAMFCATSSAKPFWEYRCSEHQCAAPFDSTANMIDRI